MKIQFQIHNMDVLACKYILSNSITNATYEFLFILSLTYNDVENYYINVYSKPMYTSNLIFGHHKVRRSFVYMVVHGTPWSL